MSVNTIENHKIKAILFDLGGVLLNIDYHLTEKAFVNLGVSNFNKIYSQALQSTLFDDFETGKISPNEFLEQLSTYIEEDHRIEDLQDAWNAMLLDFPSHRIDLLKSLRSSYNVLLLSNTNEIHFKTFNKKFEDEYGFNFTYLFTRAYYSHLIGQRKPNSAVFQLILQEQNLHPEEMIFIDDSIQHVEEAKNLGIKSFLLEKGTEVSNLLSSIGVLT